MTRQAVDSLLAAVNTRPNSKLLDVASGPGYVAAEAARRGLDATGADIAEDTLEQLKRRYPAQPVRAIDKKMKALVDIRS